MTFHGWLFIGGGVFSDKLTIWKQEPAPAGRSCQCLMQNTNNRIGKNIFSLFAPLKFISDPILDNAFYFIFFKKWKLLSSISQNFFLNIPYPDNFFPKYSVSRKPQIGSPSWILPKTHIARLMITMRGGLALVFISLLSPRSTDREHLASRIRLFESRFTLTF